MKIKDCPEDLRALKEKDFNFRLPMEGTNISVIYDTEFFIAISDRKHENYKHAKEVWKMNCKQAFSSAEPGMSFNFLKDAESLRNAPVSGDTRVLTDEGYQRVYDIVGEEVIVWTGLQWAKTVFKKTKEMTPTIKISMTGGREIVCDPDHDFILDDGTRINAKDLEVGSSLKVSIDELYKTNPTFNSKFYTLGYIYGDGTFHKKYPRAEATFCTEESKSCIEFLDKNMITSINKNDSRGFSRVYFKNDSILKDRNKSLFPEDIYKATYGEQLSFVAGLFDSDGNYFKKHNRVRLSSKYKSFLEGVRRILESNGILSGISTSGISTFGKSQGYTLTVNTEYVSRF
jgi:intein/homing endonuclease